MIEVNENTKLLPLGKLANYINGRGFKASELTTKGLPIIRIANLNNKNAPYDFYKGYLDDAHTINTGDILVSWSASLDTYIWDRETAALNQHIFKVVPNLEKVDKEYLYFVLKFSMMGLRKIAHGATMKHVTRPEFEGFNIAVVMCKDTQRKIATKLKTQLAEVETARKALEIQEKEIVKLANSYIRHSIEQTKTTEHRLGDVLIDVKKGIGETWKDYPVLGATRNGLAPAKEPPGKYPHRYKPVFNQTVFYNPMRIMIGSIAFVDNDDKPGITSPDYVALQGKENQVDSRWFYYWLRSPYGEHCISSLARGAVRERMLFNRLAEGVIQLPSYQVQYQISKSLAALRPIKNAIQQQLDELNKIPERILTQAFNQL